MMSYEQQAEILGLYMYPLAGGAAQPVHNAVVSPGGLKGDRRLTLAMQKGRSDSNRFDANRNPRIQAVKTVIGPDIVSFTAPFDGKEETIAVPRDFGKEKFELVENGNSSKGQSPDVVSCDVLLGVEQFFGDYFGRGDLVMCWRPDSYYDLASKDANLRQHRPLHLVFESTIEAINASIENPYSVLAFRPNLVLGKSGEGELKPFGENDLVSFWNDQIGYAHLAPTTRGMVTGLRPESGLFYPQGPINRQNLAETKIESKTVVGAYFGMLETNFDLLMAEETLRLTINADV